METRKVQLTGGSTYTVSIPKQWAEENDIKAGGQLHLFPCADGSLMLRADPRIDDERTSTRVTVDRLSENNLRRTIQALYMVGLDRVLLVASDGFTSAQKRIITAATSNLIGVEVIEEADNRTVLRSLLSTPDVSIRQTVIQLQFVALAMYREAIAAVVEGNADGAGHVVERDDEADRLFGLVSRYFQRSLSDMGEVNRLGLDRPAVFEYYTTARQLERIADHAERIAATAIRLENQPDGPVVEEITVAADRSQSVIEDAASVLLGAGTVEQAYTALSNRNDLRENFERIDHTLYEDDVSEAYLLGLVLDSVKRATDYGANIAETAVQATVRTEETRLLNRETDEALNSRCE